ncbi:hypothetical protein K7X08_016867 [Anisodus acutangulus]|uniref:Uncharacterized protein n=1 Tax=Anisodus acutangulus TaxID=402998 RepID=A0A9Q1R7Q0_9SOLA|nr:hypothetical protein K7X08_016867 [Anisodus acutangulus]
MSLLSPHDRSLYDLSKQLWHPDFAHTSPFNADNKSKKSRPKNDPAHDPSHHPTRDPTGGPSREGVWVSEEEDEVGQSNNENGDGNLSEVNVELETGDIMEEKRVDVDGPVRVGVGFGIEDIGAKVVMDVFDECLKDFRNGERSNLGESLDMFEERWKEQRVAELDVLARRMSVC